MAPRSSTQGRHVEHVAEDLAVRLEDDRERAVLAGDGQQIGRLLALHPQRRALAGPAAGQQQGTGRVLAEARGEQCRATELGHQQVLDLLRLEQERRLDRGAIRLDALRKTHGDAVVGPDRLDLEPVPFAQSGLDGHRPWGMDAPAEWGQDGDPPVAELVAEALHDDGAVGRQGTGHLTLLAQVGDEVACRQLVQRVILPNPGLGRLRAHRFQLAQEGTDGPTELHRSADGIAVPERHLAGLAGSGRDDHSVRPDLLDPPRRRTEQECLADA